MTQAPHLNHKKTIPQTKFHKKKFKDELKSKEEETKTIETAKFQIIIIESKICIQKKVVVSIAKSILFFPLLLMSLQHELLSC